MAFLARPLSRPLHLRASRGFLLSYSLLSSSGQSNGRNSVSRTRTRACYLSTVVEELDFERDGLHDDVKMMERENALRHALSSLAGDFGRESMLSLRRFFSSRRQPVISTGSLKLDLALEIGGLPRGRIVEIYGKEASGKTTLALHIIKEAQKLGGYCAYFDAENALDPSLAESMGINTENLLLFRPNSAENLLSAVDTLTKSGSLDVIVIDSVAALVPQCEIDEPIGCRNKDIQSRIMTQALRKIHCSLFQSKTLIVFVNQVRSVPKYGQGFGGHRDEVTCGGNALKFYAAVRMRLVRMGLLKTDDKPTGLGVCVEVVKNKLAPAKKKAELGIMFGKGFCLESEVLELACDNGIILKEGSTYNIYGEVFHAKHEVEEFLAQNDGVLQKITMILRSYLLENGE
ncbi:DNA repair protein recA homolog 2, mitochondrial isoform X1 [Eucalyptus grandis]|uniref:DNA repair protein recA homolog 2, mitochondrial isoform X1 n=1 Tax=Eucalyptus grandis TaxID=71139 RepID=UPI00192E8E73|nr:DNA repair protein recA homolog 2, mitochondrial isoform X1 [Eucalyptus grandis]